MIGPDLERLGDGRLLPGGYAVLAIFIFLYLLKCGAQSIDEVGSTLRSWEQQDSRDDRLRYALRSGPAQGVRMKPAVEIRVSLARAPDV